MRSRTRLAGACGAALLLVAFQQTPRGLAATYDSLADAILATKQAEASLMQAVLHEHMQAAQAAYQAGDWGGCAAQMALFANEGDNAIAGVRKRLVEGGHHHHADGEAKGIYDPGFVVVTREAKQAALAAAGALRQASTDAERQAAWRQFTMVAEKLMG
jgi:hypothetical protein